ncbi:MAG: hypothetical protein ACREGR_04055 [Minisyncoccia bacterium]
MNTRLTQADKQAVLLVLLGVLSILLGLMLPSPAPQIRLDSNLFYGMAIGFILGAVVALVAANPAERLAKKQKE